MRSNPSGKRLVLPSGKKKDPLGFGGQSRGAVYLWPMAFKGKTE